MIPCTSNRGSGAARLCGQSDVGRRAALRSRRSLSNAAYLGDHRRQVDDRRPSLPIDPGTPTLQRAAEADSGYFQEDVDPDSAQPRTRRALGPHRLSQVQPKTEYRLTDNGHKLREPIAWLCEWGVENREFIDSIIEARARTILMPISHKP